MLLPFSNIVGSVTIRAHIDHSRWEWRDDISTYAAASQGRGT